MGTNVFWGDVVFGAVRSRTNGWSEWRRWRCSAYQEAGEL